MSARMSSSILFAIVAASALILPSIAEAGCTLYQHRDYGGSRYKLRDGQSMFMADSDMARCSTTSDVGPNGESRTTCDVIEPSWNDQASSFKVTAGCTMTLWQHINRGGARFVRSNSVKYVGSAWNDQASQADCSCN